MFASGRDGYASDDPDARDGTLGPLFEQIVAHVPSPGLDKTGKFSFLATLLDRDNFMGRVITGRVQSGTITVNDPIHAIDMDGKVIEVGRATKLMSRSKPSRLIRPRSPCGLPSTIPRWPGAKAPRLPAA
jgi:GTP-binding protein